MGLEPLYVCLCVRMSTFSNMNISETSGPIAIKFCLKQHWGGRKAALVFWGQIGSELWFPWQQIAPIGKRCCLFFSVVILKARISSKFGQIGPRAVESGALERLEKSP